MIKYKIDVAKELKKIGLNSTIIKRRKIFSQATFQKIKTGNTNIAMETLNKLCFLLDCRPEDIIRYVESDEDREQMEDIRGY